MKQATFQCAHCGDKMRRDAYDSIFPKENTPAEDISIRFGAIRFSLLCTNPKCHKYTITCVHPEDLKRLAQRYAINKSDS